VNDLFWARAEGGIVFGRNDCCLTVADVLAAEGRVDLMTPYRGRYKTRRGFARLIARTGHRSLADAVAASFSAHGHRVDVPARLDVALVKFFDAVTQSEVVSPAIFDAGFWFMRSDSGALVVKDPGGLVAWRINDA
jgi:hypothetical protein